MFLAQQQQQQQPGMTRPGPGPNQVNLYVMDLEYIEGYWLVVSVHLISEATKSQASSLKLR